MSDEFETMEEVFLDQLIYEIRGRDVIYRDPVGRFLFPQPVTYSTSTVPAPMTKYTYSTSTNTWSLSS